MPDLTKENFLAGSVFRGGVALYYGDPWKSLIREIRDKFKMKIFLLEITMYLKRKIDKTETESKCRPFFTP